MHLDEFLCENDFKGQWEAQQGPMGERWLHRSRRGREDENGKGGGALSVQQIRGGANFQSAESGTYGERSPFGNYEMKSEVEEQWADDEEDEHVKKTTRWVPKTVMDRQWKQWAKEQEEITLSPLTKVVPERLSRMGNRSDGNEYPGWTLVEFTVDSGATETVMGLSQLSQVPLQKSSTSHGARYEVANGAIIENQGERRFIGVCFDCEGNARGIARRFTAQVCDVNKALLSVGRLEDAGYEVKFGGRGRSWIRDNLTGEKMMMDKRGHSYILELWVRTGARAAGFARQGDKE